LRSIFWRIDTMRKLGTFDIPFTGLKLGTHRYQFEIDNAFFDHFEFNQLSDAQFKVEMDLEKQSTMMILHFDLSGRAEINCDTCGEEFVLPVEYKDRIIVKFGDEEMEQSEEIWVIPHHEHKINIAHLIYEFAHLSLPSRRVHPDGECNEEVLERLNDFERHENELKDPRWEGLKKIKKDLK